MCEKCGNKCPEKRRENFQKNFEYDAEYFQQRYAVIGLTSRCNLKCTYCFAHQKNEDITLEICEQTIKLLKEKSEKPYVVFFGGEPLLMFDSIIKPIVEKYADEVEFGITTNGVLLNEDVVDFFYKYKIRPLLSFDGVEEVQNIQRGEFETILRNIPYLLLRFPQTRMRATVTNTSIPYMLKTIKMAEALLFKNITFCPDSSVNWSAEDFSLLCEEFTKIGEYTADKLLHNQPLINIIPIQKMFSLIQKGASEKILFNNSMERCGLGTTGIAVTPKGLIIPCQEKITKPDVILGDVWNGINNEVHKSFLQNYWDNIQTLKCEGNCDPRLFEICGTDTCPSHISDLNFEHSANSSLCIWEKALFSTVNRLYFLFSYSNLSQIADYFNGGNYD